MRRLQPTDLHRGVVPLTSKAGQSRDVVGNKAAQLAHLMARGYDVPQAVALTGDFDGGHKSVRNLVTLLTAQRIFPPWAVRSSSTAEDSARAAFPGIFASILGVADAAGLADAIRRVRDSSNTERARAYARGRELDLGASRMTVIVQELVDAAAAGVAFSRDPVTLAPVIAVEASWGLGEPLVGGEVTPDSWIVDRGTITERRVGSKHLGMYLDQGAVIRRAAPDHVRAQLCLTDSEVLRIASMAERLEADLGAPQDVEWALAQERTVKVLQARPITTEASS